MWGKEEPCFLTSFLNVTSSIWYFPLLWLFHSIFTMSDIIISPTFRLVFIFLLFLWPFQLSDRVPVFLRTCLFRPAYCGVWQSFLLWTPPASASRLQDCLVWCQFYCFSRAYDVPWLGAFSGSCLGFSCIVPKLQITQYGWALFSYQFIPIRVFPF